jgi:hypothetical protein
MSWTTRRQEPYTTAGIARLACIRCGAKAFSQWQICADGNNHRPLCLACDIDLNRAVLEWMGHPDAARLVSAYKAKQET